jgi:hypothetical protein
MMEVSKSEFARMEGVSRSRVYQWITSQIITCLPNGRINVEKARRELAANRDGFKRLEWDMSRASGKESKEVIEEFIVQKAFTTKIDGFDDEEFLVGPGTIMRVYSWPGSKRVEVAFFPPGSSTKPKV